ncbi:class I SAM-dependent methyltransferase [Actinomyces lilanjuaniae]|uniref:class I SAM-dependent methyltransferase n=1 Tax=Actinomyces lilanjuaniae TaxID=2321394 RepID=UPI0013C4B027|nr:class I SAM-dependent methyltransferase [Actinomyces lilanjuaniae]
MEHDFYTALRYARHTQHEVGLRYWKHSARVLDVGCQLGALGQVLADTPHDYTGLDMDSSVLASAQASLPAAHFLQGDVESPSVTRNGTYDVVVCSLVIGLLKNWRQAYLNMIRLTKQNGHLFLVDLLRNPWHRPPGDHSVLPYIQEQVARSLTWQEVEELAHAARSWAGNRNVRLRRLLDDGTRLAPDASHCAQPDRDGLSVFELWLHPGNQLPTERDGA